MVYPGRPSRGCHQCRRRKIGCDQTRPQCQRCLSSGRTCPGYRDEMDVVLRSENERTRQRVMTRQSQRESTQAGPAGPPSTGGELITLVPSSDLPTDPTVIVHEGVGTSSAISIPPSLGPSWEDQSVAFFFDQYVLMPAGLARPGWLEFLPDLYHESASSNSCVKSSVAAAAYANLANQSSIPWMSVQARQCYGEALRSINLALRDPELALTDETITSIFLLGLYENISGEKRALLGNHGDGLANLIRMRGNMTSERRRGLFRIIHALMQGRCLGSKQRPAQESIEFFAKVPKINAGSRLAAAFMSVCRIVAKVDEIKKSDEPMYESRQRMLDLMSETDTVDADLRAWNTVATPWWVYEDISAIEGLETGNSVRGSNPAEEIHIYQDTWSAIMWNFYRTARISLHNTLLECADLLDIADWPGREGSPTGSPSSRYAKSVSIIDDMINEICSSIPYMLGDVDKNGKLMQEHRKAVTGFLGMWPLFIAKNCPYATPEQVAQVKAALLRISNVMGIKQACVMHDDGPLPQP